MYEIRSTYSLAFLLLAACSSSSSFNSSSNDGGSVADSAADPSAVDAGPNALDQAEGYSNGNVSCASDSDCCVVFDECTNKGLVVGAADKANVSALCSEYDEYEDSLGSAGFCTGCIAPSIQVSCVNNKCIGATLPLSLPDGGTVDPSLSQNHCGSTSDSATGKSGSILGC
jgi:hypothetical protein